MDRCRGEVRFARSISVSMGLSETIDFLPMFQDICQLSERIANAKPPDVPRFVSGSTTPDAEAARLPRGC